MNAITNIGQTGAPVYLINGTEVVASDMAFWTGGGLLNPISIDLQGFQPSDHLAWTGTGSNGTSIPNSQLGHTGFTEYGNPLTALGSSWLPDRAMYSFVNYSMYGISQPLTVVPEPSSIVLWLTAAGCGAVGAYVRRRRAGRRGRSAHRM